MTSLAADGASSISTHGSQMGEHTPGPWQAMETPASTNQDWVVATVHGQRTHRLASVFYTGIENQDEANARLMAAAPDALDFALFYDAYMNEQFPDGLQPSYDARLLHPKAAEAWGRCKTFIAKATGER